MTKRHEEIVKRWPMAVRKQICEFIFTAVSGHAPEPLSKRAQPYYNRFIKMMEEED